VNALGGTAFAVDDDLAFAEAHAYGIYGDLIGNMTGNIIVGAQAGEASIKSYANTSAFACGIYGDSIGNLAGNIIVTARGGPMSSASSYGDAFAYAYGVLGDFTGDLSGTINAIAIGGMAGFPSHRAASAFVAGIEGDQINISNFTGNISVQAISGLEIENSVTNVSTASAKGVSADEKLYLNALSGSIHAEIEAPDGYTVDDLPEDSIALAIEGGEQSDTILLGDVDLIGDTDLNTGTNQITVFGDTRIEGNIVATDGWNEFNINSGMLTPVGTVRISNLYNNQLNVASGGGFAFDLVGDPGNSLNSKVIIDGILSATDPVAIAAYAAEGTHAKELFGNRYEVIVAEEFDATFFDSLNSLFAFDIEMNETNVFITPTGLKPQVGASTPSGNSVSMATIQSAQTVMNDLSARSRSMRSVLREAASKRFSGALASASTTGQRKRVNDQLNDAGMGSLLPDGSASPVSIPRPWMEEKWRLFVRQFTDLGSQDSDGSIAGFDWKSSGSIVGAEKVFDQSLLIGLAGGMVWTDLDGKQGAGGGASKMGIATLYGSYFTDTWFAEAGFSYAHAWNDAQRIATDGQHYTGKYESDLVWTLARIRL